MLSGRQDTKSHESWRVLRHYAVLHKLYAPRTDEPAGCLTIITAHHAAQDVHIYCNDISRRALVHKPKHLPTVTDQKYYRNDHSLKDFS